MPEVPHHAFEVTISLPGDTTATMTKELSAWLKMYTIWYAMKHELGENGKLHIHIAAVKEIANTIPNPKSGAQTASNFKRKIVNDCSSLTEVKFDPRYSFVVAPMKSDVFIAEYLQKEGQLVYYDIPKDLSELQPYFADLLKKKDLNPEYTALCKKYLDMSKPMPATIESVWSFLEQLQIDNEIRIIARPDIQMNKTEALVRQLNKSERPIAKKRKNDEAPHAPRICPGCNMDELPKYRKLCDGCVDGQKFARSTIWDHIS